MAGAPGRGVAETGVVTSGGAGEGVVGTGMGRAGRDQGGRGGRGHVLQGQEAAVCHSRRGIVDAMSAKVKQEEATVAEAAEAAAAADERPRHLEEAEVVSAGSGDCSNEKATAPRRLSPRQSSAAE